MWMPKRNGYCRWTLGFVDAATTNYEKLNNEYIRVAITPGFTAADRKQAWINLVVSIFDTPNGWMHTTYYGGRGAEELPELAQYKRPF